jgi:hypothetical protein
MSKIIFLFLAIIAIPWALSTWWKMRRARGPRERAFIGRTSVGIWMFTVGAAILLTMLSLRGQLIALPLLVVCALVIRHGWRKARARISAEESDPLSRARRLN